MRPRAGPPALRPSDASKRPCSTAKPRNAGMLSGEKRRSSNSRVEVGSATMSHDRRGGRNLSVSSRPCRPGAPPGPGRSLGPARRGEPPPPRARPGEVPRVWRGRSCRARITEKRRRSQPGGGPPPLISRRLNAALLRSHHTFFRSVRRKPRPWGRCCSKQRTPGPTTTAPGPTTNKLDSRAH